MPHANETAGETKCGKANTSTGSFSQCHLLMTLSTRCLITPSSSHMAGLHKLLVSADTRARVHEDFRLLIVYFPEPGSAAALGEPLEAQFGEGPMCLSYISAARVHSGPLVERRSCSVPFKKLTFAACGAAESVGRVHAHAQNPNLVTGLFCVQHNIASHLSTSAVDSAPEQAGLRPWEVANTDLIISRRLADLTPRWICKH